MIKTGKHYLHKLNSLKLQSKISTENKYAIFYTGTNKQTKY